MDINNRKKLQGKRIKIFTRSFSLEMYRHASNLFKTMGLPVVRLTDQMADGYFYTMLKDTSCNIAINIDEDAFVVNSEAIFDLIEFVLENEYANAGCSDAGAGVPRGGNPVITNPFFNILNLELIRKMPIDKNIINKFNYKAVKEEMIANFPQAANFPVEKYNIYDAEPYYPFFFWLAYNFKTLYLPNERHRDGISTILYNHKNEIICYHSWFARFYNVKSEQTKRINELMNEAYQMRGMEKDIFTTKDKILFILDLLIRWGIKIPMRIANWPNKWKKWHRHYKEKKIKV